MGYRWRQLFAALHSFVQDTRPITSHPARRCTLALEVLRNKPNTRQYTDGADGPNVSSRQTEHTMVALSVDETECVIDAQLLCIAGNDLGQTFAVETTVTIGRGDTDIQIHEPDVSQRHARISKRGSRFWIEDLASTNGTIVNGRRLTNTELCFGDRVQVGSAVLSFIRADVLKERLSQLQKLEGMAFVANGIAHDFNNTLQAILGGLDELRTASPTLEAQLLVDDLVAAATSTSHLVRRLMRIGRKRPETSELLDIATVVRSAIAMTKRACPGAISINTIGGVEALTRGSRNELEQAFLNVLLNARDAMQNGGTITVTTRTLALDRGAAHLSHLPSGGTFIEVVIRDDGCGMDADTAARAFEPFFTTKQGRGTGLGLAMVFSAIKNHGGSVTLETRVGSGTSVRVLLPVIA